MTKNKPKVYTLDELFKDSDAISLLFIAMGNDKLQRIIESALYWIACDCVPDNSNIDEVGKYLDWAFTRLKRNILEIIKDMNADEEKNKKSKK